MAFNNLANNASQYLVAIGWDVDKQGMNKAQKLIGDLFTKFDGWTKGVGKGYMAAAGIAVSALTAITKATTDLISETTKLDKINRMAAKQYFVNADTMMAYNESLAQFKDIGITDYEDLFWADEQTISQYKELIQLGQQIKAPEGLKETTELFSSLAFQVKRFNILVNNARRWIVYYIGQAMGPELIKLKNQISEFIDKLIKDMPTIAKNIAKVLTLVLRLSIALGKVAVVIGKVAIDLLKIFDKMPGFVKLLPLIGAFALGPLGKILSILTLIGLFIDDYLTWKSGGKALLDWGAFDKAITDLNETWQKFVNAFDLQNLFSDAGISLLQLVVNYFADWATEINSVIKGLNQLGEIWNKVSKPIKEFFGIGQESNETTTSGSNSFIKNLLLNSLTGALRFLPGTGMMQKTLTNMSGMGTQQWYNPTSNNSINYYDNSTNNVNSPEQAASLQTKKANGIIQANWFGPSPIV